MSFEASEIKKAIHKSQHCQRNWDLSKEIPEEDVNLFIEAISQCPSKQNVAFYRAHLIMNRELIEAIHSKTDGFTLNFETKESTTNPQTLANLLVVFEEASVEVPDERDVFRNSQTFELAQNGEVSAETRKIFERDRDMAVGIAAGYLNLTAALMGYSTGCCVCFDVDAVKKILKLEKNPLLLMGVGFSNKELGRRVHHKDKSFLFPTKSKQEIQILFFK